MYRTSEINTLAAVLVLWQVEPAGAVLLVKIEVLPAQAEVVAGAHQRPVGDETDPAKGELSSAPGLCSFQPISQAAQVPQFVRARTFPSPDQGGSPPASLKTSWGETSSSFCPYATLPVRAASAYPQPSRDSE